MALVRRLTVAVLVGGLLAGCTASPARVGGAQQPTTAPDSIVGPASTARIAPSDKYLVAVTEASRAGLKVWLEADLLARWLQGRAPFLVAAGRLRALAEQPGVLGVKVADELGTDDGLGGDQVLRFLHDVRTVLGPSVKVLVDVSLPELGCAPGDVKVAAASAACASEARSQYPGAALTVVDAMVSQHLVDALDVSTSLRTDTRYASWGISRAQAQLDAWREVVRRGWPRHALVSARKAMAVPDPYPSARQAASDLPLFVDLPRANGAQAVDVWTWRQRYQGRTVGLLPGDDALWQGLVRRRAQGADLITHFTPSQVYTSVPADLARIATVFRAVFVAAGTG